MEPATFSSASLKHSGMEQKPDATRTSKTGWLPQLEIHYALTGTASRGVPHQVMINATSVQAVETRTMALKTALKHRKTKPSLLIRLRHGAIFLMRETYSQSIQNLLMPSIMVSMQEYRGFIILQHPIIALLYIFTWQPIDKLSLRSSSGANILVPALEMKSRTLSDPFSPLHSHWFLNQENPKNFMQYIISYTHIILRPKPHLLTTLSTLTSTPALGALSQQYATPYLIYPQALKCQSEMLPKCIV